MTHYKSIYLTAMLCFLLVTAQSQSANSISESLSASINQADPLDVGVFDPAIRGKTSKFMMLFQN